MVDTRENVDEVTEPREKTNGLSTRPDPLRPGDPRELGDYRILGRLGEGGMGTVFLGRGRDTGLVAVKVIRADVARIPRYRDRFRREAAVARRVARFCTAEVLDVVDPPDGQPYLVTEFVDGPTLARAIATHGPLGSADLERVAVSVAAALTAIHGAGLVHRDLTPTNVLLSPLGARVIDFGLARVTDEAPSGPSGRVAGTPAFMSPEQARGETVTSAADIFSWGGLVIFAGSGRKPFGDGPTSAQLRRVQHADPTLGDLDPALAAVVRAAMRREPGRRPTAEELLRRLVRPGDAAETIVTSPLDILPPRLGPSTAPPTSPAASRTSPRPESGSGSGPAGTGSARGPAVAGPGLAPAVAGPGSAPAGVGSGSAPAGVGSGSVPAGSKSESAVRSGPGSAAAGVGAGRRPGFATGLALARSEPGPDGGVRVASDRAPATPGGSVPPGGAVSSDGSVPSGRPMLAGGPRSGIGATAPDLTPVAVPGPATGPLDLVLVGAAGPAGDPGSAGRRRVRLMTAAAGAVIAAALMVIGLLVHAHGGSARATATAAGQVAVPGGHGGVTVASAAGGNTAPATRPATRPAGGHGDAGTGAPTSAADPAAHTDPADASPGTDGVTIPDVVGQDAAAAETALRAAGFDTVERAYRAGSGARGTVVATDPSAGTTPTRDATVTLTVSTGPSTVTVPEVVGQDAADARAALRAAGLTVVQRLNSGPSTADAGQVDAVTPSAGTRVAARSTVTITVASDTVTVPDLHGRPAGEAQRTLTDLGLTVVQHPRPEDDPPGTVIGQTPASGGVPRGSTVTLDVARPTATGSPSPPAATGGPGPSTTSPPPSRPAPPLAP
ncbi:serine/threonine protein kinase [Frankia torreyi]|uniref:non-specific serine/threonine protein kinase n=2 Tax=Frankia TaxID=1854 RepID=A0A0D8BLZ4_9ACTN|nr:serine/threonine protein kinase [Frankia torreyi]KQM08064.1 serine/threonine protein kinase [Frankia sp. CpI1-P]